MQMMGAKETEEKRVKGERQKCVYVCVCMCLTTPGSFISAMRNSGSPAGGSTSRANSGLQTDGWKERRGGKESDGWMMKENEGMQKKGKTHETRKCVWQVALTLQKTYNRQIITGLPSGRRSGALPVGKGRAHQIRNSHISLATKWPVSVFCSDF